MLKIVGMRCRACMSFPNRSRLSGGRHHRMTAAMAQEADQGTVGAEANPVAAAQDGRPGDRRLVEQRAIAATIEQEERAMIEKDFAVPGRHAGVPPRIEKQVTAGLHADEEARHVQKEVLPVKM